ncbi:hypothetical protein LTR96_010209 [Exophiala xenobiotica]|uniref:Uncharacterized protein n=1 Tax=Vermiconidia calcicola TaxID=1690605 RepID=A0AAV9PWS7_9PEZI|nr:hypothetical protein LTR41_010005 [Exophiala xenobiotica]KAK5529422.1 hypothetical protein LTR25_009668 [Vermiconidia calcicola]KAK5538007.1 hypothetical protein LTR23_007301 [Chaetothyriales sp. CCFEE 6169]KAK5228757.1 hypothetical protein LTR72_002644 [Exophiala xenobiotica]KAK5241150.1 hypothetical protein LTS06_012207 [Exophiala xenobiotica]
MAKKIRAAHEWLKPRFGSTTGPSWCLARGRTSWTRNFTPDQLQFALNHWATPLGMEFYLCVYVGDIGPYFVPSRNADDPNRNVLYIFNDNAEGLGFAFNHYSGLAVKGTKSADGKTIKSSAWRGRVAHGPRLWLLVPARSATRLRLAPA